MNSKMCCIACLLILTVLMIGCTAPTKGLEEPPQITVKIDNQQINYVVGINEWEGTVHKREDTFESIMMGRTEADVPLFDKNKIVEISFKENPPEHFDIYDIMINENGRQLYQDRVTRHIPIELQEGTCSFEVGENMASALSSTYAPDKKDIRGFRMIASWGKNECEYAFIIKTK